MDTIFHIPRENMLWLSLVINDHHLPSGQITLWTLTLEGRLLLDCRWQPPPARDHRCLCEKIHISRWYARIVSLCRILAHRRPKSSSCSQSSLTVPLDLRQPPLTVSYSECLMPFALRPTENAFIPRSYFNFIDSLMSSRLFYYK